MAVTAISLELFKNALATITDEMAITVVRTAHSNAVRETMDFTCALCDSEGAVIAQGLGLALHLGTVPDVVRSIHRRGPYQDGDVLAVNDPYDGGTHLPDIYVIRPVFHNTGLVGYSVINMHHMDVGGRTPGSIAADNTELFQEGLRLRPVYLVRKGVPNDTIFSLIQANSRLPDKVLGDLRGQLAATQIGSRGLIELVESTGLEHMREHMKGILDYTEDMARAEIRSFPDGEYHFIDYLDDDGVGGNEVAIAVTLTIAGDRMIVDFSGSSSQVNGAVNCAYTMTRSAVYCTIRSVMRSDMPDCEGFCRPIEVVAGPGTVVNPLFPAAVAARGVTAHRICDAVFGALAKAVPDRVMAADEGGSTNISIGGISPDGAPFILLEFVYGAWGARPTKDGIDGVANLFANLANNPIEIVEAETPVEIESYGFVPDTGGAGKFRGGLAVRRQYRLRHCGATLSIRSDRRKYPPHGIAGGASGTPSSNIVNPNTRPTILPTKVTTRLSKGDVFQHTLAGAGGFGNPLARDPDQVADDVFDEKITIEHSQARYGVAVESGTGILDRKTTQKLRASMLARVRA